MHLYLNNNPRTLYLVTSSQDERDGHPSKALVFRATEDNASQAVVEFLPKDQVDLSNAVKLTTRNVKGCLGLISISNGMHEYHLVFKLLIARLLFICNKWFH